MTKRIGNFDEKTNKKAKLDDDIEALWGDDIDVDEDALDNCIKLATQVCKEDQITSTQRNNVTLLPSYSGFKTRSTLFSSTQLSQFGNNNVRPGTSKNHINSNNFLSDKHLEREIKTLQQNYEEKEGEVAILRMQLQETKEQQQKEQQKIQNEWKQKIVQTEKQMKSVKSELEFKDLEITNLKQTILKITKHNIFDSTFGSPEKATTSKIKEEKIVGEGTNIQPIILQPILDPIYPLKDVLSDCIFNVPKKEQHITPGKLVHTCRNTIPYLHNQLISANVALNKSDININCIYSDIFKVLRLVDGEFDKKENFKYMNKIIYACEQFLYDLDKFLQKIKSNLRTEDILESDSIYLKQLNSSSNVPEKSRDGEEIGVKSSVLLDLVAEIIPYSEYLQKYICRDEKLVSVDHNESLIKQFPYQIVKHQTAIPYYLLNTTLNVIRTAGEIRKVKFMTKFICATIKLLVNIHKSRNYDYVSDIFCKLTKEMILSRPPVEVICQITGLFKVASQHSSFIEFLLNKSQHSVTNKKGLLYFNADACRFYIFVMLFDNVIFNLRDEDFPINVCLNVLCFMYNTFKNCHWVHHRNAKGCECVTQLYKLTIEIIARALERYVEETKKLRLVSSEWAHFFKNPITAKVLHLMTFNSYELTEKYITVFSHYKQIEKRLQEEENVIPLEKLNITEEIPEIPSDAFANIDF